MVAGAIINAAAFTGGNYLAKYFSGDSGQAALDEKIRHDKAIEKYQAAYEKWQEDRTKLLDWVAEQDRIKDKARHDFQDTDQALGSISSRFVRPRSFAHTTAGSLVCPIVFSTNQRLACTNRAGKSVIGQFSLVNNKDGGYLKFAELFKIGKFGKYIKKH